MPASEPLVSFAETGNSVLVQRNIPEPVAYRGTSLIELRLAEDDDERRDLFKARAFEAPDDDAVPPAIGPVIAGDLEIAYDALSSGPDADVDADPDDIDMPRGSAPPLGDRMLFAPAPSSRTAAVDRLESLRSEASALGKRVLFYRNLLGEPSYRLIPKRKPPEPRIYLVEMYQLTTHLGQYGAGRVVKTFSLFPGERTKVSVRSFLKTETKQEKSSSILDSVTTESAHDFEKSIESEQANRSEYLSSLDMSAEASAGARWGWGSARAKASVKSSTNAAREEASKNISRAVERHASKASAQRDVEVNTSFEVTQTAKTETSIEREIENINASRTLNFVFRQMNQQFYSLLHLVDVRVLFSNGHPDSTYEVALHDLEDLLDRYIQDSRQADVRAVIDQALGGILDYAGQVHSDFVTARTIDGESYQRTSRSKTSVYRDPLDMSVELTVEGIITAVTKNVMRTEGMVVEALLGESDALDHYASSLQSLEVDRRAAELRQLRASAAREELLLKIVQDSDECRAELLERLTCPCGRTTANHGDHHHGGQPK